MKATMQLDLLRVRWRQQYHCFDTMHLKEQIVDSIVVHAGGDPGLRDPHMPCQLAHGGHIAEYRLQRQQGFQLLHAVMQQVARIVAEGQLAAVQAARQGNVSKLIARLKAIDTSCIYPVVIGENGRVAEVGIVQHGRQMEMWSETVESAFWKTIHMPTQAIQAISMQAYVRNNEQDSNEVQWCKPFHHHSSNQHLGFWESGSLRSVQCSLPRIQHTQP